MTQEGKFKEAKRIYETANADQRYVLERLFPELKEGEDEKIIKDLISHFKETIDNIRSEEIIPRNATILVGKMQKWIAWLEKQGEQKTINGIAKEVCKNKASAVAFLKSTGIMNENGELADEYKIEQGEQKSINGELSEFKDKLCELFQRFRWYKDETPTNGDILEYIDVHIQELFDSTNEQKLKWSEEDKEMKDWLIEYFKYRISNSNILEEKVNCKKALNWIESLHPQNRWKPSEEQMEALDDFIYAKYPNVEKYGAAVKSLYQDLKKLREE